MDSFQISASEIPVLICRGQLALRNPNNQEIANCLGFNESIDQTHVRDLVIIGAGPSGLSRSIWCFRRTRRPNAGDKFPWWSSRFSSRIENYLGFPTGISGQDLAVRAYNQAQKFGARMLVANATRLICDRKPYVIELENGARISTHTVIIATGAQYRKLPLENLSRFEGAGVYHGATFVEAQLCGGEELVVVGGGNSAGQVCRVFSTDCKACVHASQIYWFGCYYVTISNS